MTRTVLFGGKPVTLAGTEIKVEDESYLILREEDILAIIN